jgi:hypothetical protein
MTITKCDLRGKEMSDKNSIVYAGAGIFRMLAAKEFCPECGKPVVQFLKRAEKKLKSKKPLSVPP